MFKDCLGVHVGLLIHEFTQSQKKLSYESHHFGGLKKNLIWSPCHMFKSINYESNYQFDYWIFQIATTCLLDLQIENETSI